MNIDYFNQLWQSNSNKSEMEKYWDKRAEEFIKHSQSKIKQSNDDNLINYIKNKAKLCSNSKVLDIGCGPGNHAIKFSKIVDDVTAVDISNEMIEYAHKRTSSLGISNIQFKKVFWEEADIKKEGFEKNFDLVFASMCPGINNKDTLFKMIDSSNKSCFVSSFVNKKEYILDPDTEEVLGTSQFNPHKNKAYSVFNILWLKGYYPEIRFTDNRLEKKDTCDKIITDFVFGKNNPIFNILKRIDKQKTIKYIMESKVAWIYWEI